MICSGHTRDSPPPWHLSLVSLALFHQHVKSVRVTQPTWIRPCARRASTRHGGGHHVLRLGLAPCWRRVRHQDVLSSTDDTRVTRHVETYVIQSGACATAHLSSAWLAGWLSTTSRGSFLSMDGPGRVQGHKRPSASSPPGSPAPKRTERQQQDAERDMTGAYSLFFEQEESLQQGVRSLIIANSLHFSP